MSMNTPVPMPVVPAKVRFVLYWTSYFLSMAAALLSAGWQIVAAASPDVSAPLWIKLASPLMLLVVAQLNALAGSNVTSQPSLVVRREEGGAASLLAVGLVVALVGLILLLATTLDILGIILLIVGVLVALYSAVAGRTGAIR
jgi:hypothetical protein